MATNNGATKPAGYVVLDSMPGYMPDNEPFLLDTRRDAETAARYIADQYREDAFDNGCRVIGSARGGGYVILHGKDACFPGTVWRIVEIVPLSESEAAEYREASEE